MTEGVNQLAEGLGKAIETVPELYTDLIQPSAKETGKFIARIPRAINAALSGVDQWIEKQEYNVEETKKLLAQKLENVSPDKIVPPEPYVAVPALQAISYSMNSDELRNLYANLLAKSMLTETKDSVHPAFIEIIKQMSPIDAQIFTIICKSELRPLINLQFKLNTGGRQYIQYHCSWIGAFPIKQIATSIDNLIRLGLIEIPSSMSYSNERIYDLVKKNPLFKELEQKTIDTIKEKGNINYEKTYINITDLSNLFFEICVKEP